jgi:prolipoprotein diacylglyceryltransferase
MPPLFVIWGVAVYPHNFFLLLALLVLLCVLVIEARRRHWPAREVFPITLSAFAGGIIGARVAMLLFAGGSAIAAQSVPSYFDATIGPGSVLGAIVGAYVGGHLASRSVAKTGCTCDAFAPAMALGLAVGRIGDYLAFEDGLGTASTLPWAVSVPGVDYLVHPTPLYDASFDLLWFAVLVTLRDDPRLQQGNLLKLAMIGYAIFRFFVEFVRNNEVLALGLTGQQFISLAIVGALLAYWLRQRRASLA